MRAVQPFAAKQAAHLAGPCAAIRLLKDAQPILRGELAPLRLGHDLRVRRRSWAPGPGGLVATLLAPRAGKIISCPSLSLQGFRLHRPTVIPKVAGVSVSRGLSANSDHRSTRAPQLDTQQCRGLWPCLAELDALGKTLIDNARQLVEADRLDRRANASSPAETRDDALVVQARAWASSLDRSSFQVQRTFDGSTFEAIPPPDVVAALQDGNEDLERAQNAIGLFVRYHIARTKEMPEPVGRDDLVADIATVLDLIENPPPDAPHNLWDVAALVASTALTSSRIERHAPYRLGGLVMPAHEFEHVLRVRTDRNAARVSPWYLDHCRTTLRPI